MLNCIAVGAGGFIGSVLRYLVSLIPIKKCAGFPINTLIVNILGAFLIGVVVAVFSKNADLDDRFLLFLKVGVCGGFTTFSSFALESVDLFKAEHVGIALLYITLSTVLCILAVCLGHAAVR